MDPHPQKVVDIYIWILDPLSKTSSGASAIYSETTTLQEGACLAVQWVRHQRRARSLTNIYCKEETSKQMAVCK